jgi:hypothetical protein
MSAVEVLREQARQSPTRRFSLRELVQILGIASAQQATSGDIVDAVSKLTRAGISLDPSLKEDGGVDSPRSLTVPPITLPLESVVSDYLRTGESERVEFKSSFLKPTEHIRSAPTEVIQASVVKAVAGMMNHRGGVVLVGVDDTGGVLGIQADLDEKCSDLDTWHQKLAQTISKNLKPKPDGHVSYDTVEIDGRLIAVVTVTARHPQLTWALVNASNGQEKYALYHRTATRNSPIDSIEIEAFILARLQEARRLC